MVKSSAKLTKRTVDAATPRPGRFIVWDAELKGFALRVAESGTKTYILRYRPRGTGRAGPRRFMVLGRHGVITPDEARTQAKTILGAVAAGRRPGQGAVAGEFWDADRATRRTLHQRARQAKAQVANRRQLRGGAEQLSCAEAGKKGGGPSGRAEISQLHLSLRDRPYQANRLVAVIASMYSLAARQGIVPRGANPAQGIERFRELARERYLGIEELNRLGETLRMAETEGLPWRSDPEKPQSKHLPREENRRTILSPEVVWPSASSCSPARGCGRS